MYNNNFFENFNHYFSFFVKITYQQLLDQVVSNLCLFESIWFGRFSIALRAWFWFVFFCWISANNWSKLEILLRRIYEPSLRTVLFAPTRSPWLGMQWQLVTDKRSLFSSCFWKSSIFMVSSILRINRTCDTTYRIFYNL